MGASLAYCTAMAVYLLLTAVLFCGVIGESQVKYKKYTVNKPYEKEVLDKIASCEVQELRALTRYVKNVSIILQCTALRSGQCGTADLFRGMTMWMWRYSEKTTKSF